MPKYRWPPQKRLKLHLVEHDVPMAWLSERTGLSQVTLSGIVTGRVRATPNTRSLIAEALGVAAGTLFVGVEDPTDDELAEAELWQTMPSLDDETIEKLRRLLFGQHASRTKKAIKTH